MRVYGAIGSMRRSMHRKARALCVLFLLAACTDATAAELLVSAATSLTNAFREIGTAFETTHPGTTVAFNFAASDLLLAQIVRGAPADVFAAADEATMDRAEQAGALRAGTRRDFAANRLVVVIPSAAPAFTTLEDLAAPRFRRIALGSPKTVPAGRYAKQALERAGVWAKLEPRLIYAGSVRQSLDYVARAEVDAGFVYATDAAIMPDKVKVVLEVPTVSVRYPIAVTALTRQPADARGFVDFVATPQMQNVLRRYGFQSP
jgi:molybdate transport system substrate-binding protein